MLSAEDNFLKFFSPEHKSDKSMELCAIRLFSLMMPFYLLRQKSRFFKNAESMRTQTSSVSQKGVNWYALTEAVGKRI